MKASVSREVLKNVKNALSRFEMDVGGMTAKTEKYAGETLGRGSLSLAEAQKDVEYSRTNVNRLKDKVARYDYDITCAEGEFRKCLQQIDWLYKEISSNEAEVNRLREQLKGLRAKTESECDQNGQARISALDSQIAQLESRKVQLEQQRNTQESRKEELNARLKNLKKDKGICIEQLQKEERILDQRVKKEERLRSAYAVMERDLRDYVEAVHRLEQNSASTAQRNLNAVQKCIQSIEKYLSTSL